MDINTDPNLTALTRLLDATAMRQRVLANNVANADTPGFVRQEVNFSQQLTDAVNAGDYSNFNPTATEDRSELPRGDGNNVSVEKELAEMNKNALLHQMAIQLMQAKLSMTRSAITGNA